MKKLKRDKYSTFSHVEYRYGDYCFFIKNDEYSRYGGTKNIIIKNKKFTIFLLN